jgi:hypothetical protein
VIDTYLTGYTKPCENVKRTVRAYLAWSRAHIATAVTLLLRATHVGVGTANSILFLRATYRDMLGGEESIFVHFL